MQEKGVTLSNVELFFLCGLMGSQCLIGVADPFPGYLTEEIKEIWEDTQKSLIQRELLLPKGQGLVPTAELQRLIGICGFPSKVGRFDLVQPKQRHQAHYYLREEAVVEKIAHQDKELKHTLTLLGNPEEATLQILQKLNFQHIKQVEVPEIHVQRATWDGLVKHAYQQEEAELSKLLQGEMSPGAGIEILRQALLTDFNLGQWVSMCWENKQWQMEQINFLISPEGQWQIIGGLPQEEVILKPSSGPDLRALLRSLIA